MIHSTLSPLRLSTAQRSAPKPYSSAKAGNAASTGSLGVPPWSHSRLEAPARSACSAVSSIVVAPATEVPGTMRPAESRPGTDASVVTSVAYGALTTDSDPHGPRTGSAAIPVPSVNLQPVMGAQLGCVAASTTGSTAWPSL